MTDEVAERVESACGRPVEALLRAELDELKGTGSTELAGHIRACERCGALARSIVAGYEKLDDALEPAIEVNAPRIVALGRARADAGVRRVAWWAIAHTAHVGGGHGRRGIDCRGISARPPGSARSAT